MSVATITRRVTFSAVHRYRRADWDDARNEQTFGSREITNYHGHEYVCDVSVSGPIDETTGMILDLRELDRAIRAEVTDRFHNRNLNEDVAESADGKQIPTGENLARLIATNVQRALGSRGVVSSVSVAEDATLSSTWRSAG